MSTQMTQNPSNLPSKQVLTDFVHDVADMEKSAFTMREAARRAREETQQQQRSLELAVETCRNAQDRAKKQCDAYQVQLAKGQKKGQYIKNFQSGMIIGWIVVLAILAFIFMIGCFGRSGYVDAVSWEQDKIAQIQMENPDEYISYYRLQKAEEELKGNSIFLFVMVCIMIGWNVLYGIPTIIYINVQHGKFLDKTTQLIQSSQELLKNEAQRAFESLSNLQAFKDKIPRILARADRLDADAELIEEKIRQCYALDIIKPAYRKMVCVVVLDEIFINDKADTMREAMILCDAEIRHADVMSKMDKIIDALHMLSYRLQSMTMVLDSINTNVGLIAQDVYDMKNTQEQMNYSMDAIRRSAENADQYINQRRMGGL